MTNQSFPDVTSVTSEALQLKIRQLLPSQTGFGSDLMAQNVIVPIIDLTASAEGSDVRSDLQSALAFGSQTVFSENNSNSVIANTTGFFRIFGLSVGRATAGGPFSNDISISDGSTSKKLFSHEMTIGSNDTSSTYPLDLIVFLRVGDTVTATSSNVRGWLNGSTRQIADSNGTLVQPVGFTPQ